LVFYRSVHVVDLSRFKEAPNYGLHEPNKINWGKWTAVCRTIAIMSEYQHRFNLYNTHDFISRPKVQNVIMNSPLMLDKVSY
jgi:hypothetical protein